MGGMLLVVVCAPNAERQFSNVLERPASRHFRSTAGAAFGMRCGESRMDRHTVAKTDGPQLTANRRKALHLRNGTAYQLRVRALHGVSGEETRRPSAHNLHP
jgi:hypothetical protein